MATILQSELLTNFLYPLLLTFFICFGLLEKVKIFGEGKTQLNAMVSLVIGLIFVGAVFPKLIMENLVNFMTIGLVVIFVGLMLWGFVSGNNNFLADGGKKIHKVLVFVLVAAVLLGVFWATGIGDNIVTGLSKILAFIFGPNTGSFWTNFLFILVIVAAILIATGINPFKRENKSMFFKLKD